MFLRPTCRDYVDAYASGRCNPLEVAESLMEAIDASTRDDSLNAFVEWHRSDVYTMAEASRARYRAQEPLSPLDGVPVAIKDEVDMRGYRTRAGTTFRGREVAAEDSTAVRRLRQAGALLIGKTHMTEIGMGGTGLNPHYDTPRNPHAPDRLTGGSSSGSAAAVAAGLCPVALGSDAGGSIRMPAAICGVYGFKPTYGRIPTTGGALLSWSLDHLGPLGASVDDLQAFYAITAGPDDVDESSWAAPKENRSGRVPRVQDLSFAWCPAWVEGVDDDVMQTFEAALDTLRDHGAHVEEVELEWHASVRKVGYVTFCVEAAATQHDWLKTHRDAYNMDTRLLLAIGARVSGVEYLQAQRVRTLIRQEFARVCSRFDALLHPTLASVAPRFDSAKHHAIVDTELNAKVAHFTFAGTLTGFPSLSLPCGVGADDLPVGLHLMSAPWTDSTLLNVATAVDQIMPPLSKPTVWWDPLGSGF